MRGGKLIVIFLLLSLTVAQWIKELPTTELQVSIVQPQVQQMTIFEPVELEIKEEKRIQEDQQPIIVEPVRLEIIEIHPQTIAHVVQQTIMAEAVLIAPAEPTGPIREHDQLNMPENHDRKPIDEAQKHHQRGHKSKMHKKGKYHDKREDVATAGSIEEQNEGCLEMLMDNGVVLLVLLGVIGLVLVKVCIRSNKCATRRACRTIKNSRQPINMDVRHVQNSGNDAIEETIRYHEAQILKLRNAPYNNMPAYMPYQ